MMTEQEKRLSYVVARELSRYRAACRKTGTIMERLRLATADRPALLQAVIECEDHEADCQHDLLVACEKFARAVERAV